MRAAWLERLYDHHRYSSRYYSLGESKEELWSFFYLTPLELGLLMLSKYEYYSQEIILSLVCSSRNVLILLMTEQLRIWIGHRIPRGRSIAFRVRSNHKHT